MIQIRHAREIDTQAIAEVYVETWQCTYAGTLPNHVLIGMNPQKLMISFARALKNHREIILIAERPNVGIIGMGSAGGNRDIDSEYKGEVYTLYVHPDYQNIGIGEKLLADLFFELTKLGINSAVIWVLALNPSRYFYEVMSGERVGDRDEQLWGTTLKEFAYGWNDLSTAIKNGRPRLIRRKTNKINILHLLCPLCGFPNKC